jgi:hypothetical protein
MLSPGTTVTSPDRVAVEGTVDEDDCRAFSGGVEIPIAGRTFRFEVGPLAEGAVTLVTVTVRDRAGNEGRASREFMRPRAAPADLRVRPWASSRIGDWARFTLGPFAAAVRLEVVRVTDAAVTVKYSAEMPGLVEAEQEDIPRDRLVPEMPPDRDLGEETLTVGGRAVRCRVVESRAEIGGRTVTFRTWVSAEVPGGLVRTMSDALGSMQVLQEVTDFGRR